MKSKKIISIAILVFIYAVAIKDTITLYYIPGSEFSSFVSNITPSLLPGIVLIELLSSIFILILLIPLKDVYNKSPPTKPPFFLSSWISGFFPILVIINNYISGIFLYSAALLIFGVILTLEIIRLNIIGVERAPISKEEIENKHAIEGLCAYITEFDYLRTPIITSISPYPFIIQVTQLSKEIGKQSFKKSYSEVYNGIIKELEPIFKNAIYVRPYNPPISEFFLRSSLRYETNLYRKRLQNEDKPNLIFGEMKPNSGFSIIIYIVLSFFISVMVTKFIYLSNIFDISIYFPILLFILIFSSIYSIFVHMSTRKRQIWGEKCDKTIKRSVQELIDYGKEYIKENNLNPLDYPLKLRHNDYNGLKYQNNGKNKYMGYFEK